jgi:hypothetical protein
MVVSKPSKKMSIESVLLFEKWNRLSTSPLTKEKYKHISKTPMMGTPSAVMALADAADDTRWTNAAEEIPGINPDRVKAYVRASIGEGGKVTNATEVTGTRANAALTTVKAAAAAATTTTTTTTTTSITTTATTTASTTTTVAETSAPASAMTRKTTTEAATPAGLVATTATTHSEAAAATTTTAAILDKNSTGEFSLTGKMTTCQPADGNILNTRTNVNSILTSAVSNKNMTQPTGAFVLNATNTTIASLVGNGTAFSTPGRRCVIGDVAHQEPPDLSIFKLFKAKSLPPDIPAWEVAVKVR